MTKQQIMNEQTIVDDIDALSIEHNTVLIQPQVFKNKKRKHWNK